MIPTVEQCYKLMDEYRMLDNIREHSLMVARVAGLITEGLRQAGQDVSMELSLAGALLHDIAKTQSLNNDSNHAYEGSRICVHHDFHEVADIVAEHVILKHGVPEVCTEREIVYYADKRVRHDEIVSLDERLEYIIVRYGQSDEDLHRRIEQNFNNCRLVEQKVFCFLPFAPKDVAGRINGHPFVFERLSI